MLIIHGKRRIEKKLGFVANFCPACHAFRCFTLKRVSMVEHVYFIPIGRAKLLQHLIECAVCGLWMGTDPSIYSKVEDSALLRGDIETLILSTYPGLREVYAGRLAFEESLKKNPGGIEPADRAKYVFEMFRLVSPMVDACYKRETEIDRPAGVGCIGTLVLFGVLLYFGLKAPGDSPLQTWTMVPAFAVLTLGGIYTVIQLALAPRRKMRRKVLPILARGLRPLDPLEGELAAVLEKCKSMRMAIGRRLKLSWLITAMRMPIPETPAG